MASHTGEPLPLVVVPSSASCHVSVTAECQSQECETGRGHLEASMTVSVGADFHGEGHGL